MKLTCTGCGVAYVVKLVVPPKSKNGFCAGCWEVTLSEQRYNIRQRYVEWMESRGLVPEWDFRDHNAEIEALAKAAAAAARAGAKGVT